MEPLSNQDSACFLCLKPGAPFTCEFCSLPYCSEEHRSTHRPPEVGDYCLPFRVLHRPEVGKYVVATRDIEPQELILMDKPAVFGPNHDSPPACLECLHPLEDDTYLCTECGLPLCGRHCETQGTFHRLECALFSKPTPTGFKFKVNFDRTIPEGQERFIAPEYCCIAPLRILRLKHTDPSLWERLGLLMDHEEERQAEVEYQKMFQVNVVDFLRKTCGFDYTEAEIFRAIGILRTNAFHIQDEAMKRLKVGGRAIFPTFSYLSHSCLSNSKYSITPKSWRLELRAQVPIRQGDEVTIQYLSFMYGQCRRKKDIPSYWFFVCRCARCRDPTDLGSYMSAVLCQKCGLNVDERGPLNSGQPAARGAVIPTDPFDVIRGDWACVDCGHRVKGPEIDRMCEELADQVMDVFEHDVEGYEKLLQNLLLQLHPNHYSVMTVKKYLADLYGTAEGYKFHQLPPEKLDLKIAYNLEFLQVVGKVDPGTTKWKGLLLHDLSSARLWKANHSFNRRRQEMEEADDGALNVPDSKGSLLGLKELKKEFLEELKNVEDLLQSCVKSLSTEPQNTREHHTMKKAKADLNMVRDLVFFSDFL